MSADSGTSRASSRTEISTSTLANMPGLSLPAGLGTQAFSSKRLEIGSTLGETKNTSPGNSSPGHALT